MRDIKFRAWDTKGKFYWFFDSETLIEGWIYKIRPDTQSCIKENSQELSGSNIGDWEQFTGLKDKNDKGFYDADILKIKNYYQDNFKVFQVESGEWMLDDGTDGCVEMSMKDDREVIGNIHENPELLK